jgi:hypothetical protein
VSPLFTAARYGAVSSLEQLATSELRLAYLAPEVLKRLTCRRDASTVSLGDVPMNVEIGPGQRCCGHG